MKNSNKGFTLIELLAVIVIMGILMMVAIPAMSKVIENSRKDTFVETAQTYANAVSTLWYADGLKCETKLLSETGSGTPEQKQQEIDNSATVASAVGNGKYYVAINSKLASNAKVPTLIERGGKSSWGNNDVYGYIMVDVPSDGKSATFYASLTDGLHHISSTVVNTKVAEKLTRKDVQLDKNTEVDAYASIINDNGVRTDKGKELKICYEV